MMFWDFRDALKKLKFVGLTCCFHSKWHKFQKTYKHNKNPQKILFFFLTFSRFIQSWLKNSRNWINLFECSCFFWQTRGGIKGFYCSSSNFSIVAPCNEYVCLKGILGKTPSVILERCTFRSFLFLTSSFVVTIPALILPTNKREKIV